MEIQVSTIHGIGGDIRVADEYDEDGRVTGGEATGTGIRVKWQDHSVDRANGEEPTGAFAEDLIAVATERLRAYQNSTLPSEHNDRAIEMLEEGHRRLMTRREATNGEGKASTG